MDLNGEFTLTKNQSVSILGFTTGLLIMNAVFGRMVLKDSKKVNNRFNKLADVGNELVRIAAYQEKLIDKHIDSRVLDEFDEMVMNDMHDDFEKHLNVFRQLLEKEETE